MNECLLIIGAGFLMLWFLDIGFWEVSYTKTILDISKYSIMPEHKPQEGQRFCATCRWLEMWGCDELWGETCKAEGMQKKDYYSSRIYYPDPSKKNRNNDCSDYQSKFSMKILSKGGDKS